jgi:flagellar motor switch protein FliM
MGRFRWPGRAPTSDFFGALPVSVHQIEFLQVGDLRKIRSENAGKVGILIDQACHFFGQSGKKKNNAYQVRKI